MRNGLIVGVVAATVVFGSAPLGASTPPPARVAPAIRQNQTGEAGGSAYFDLQGGQSHSGRYNTTGQLGHGTYTFTFTSHDKECIRNGDASTAHGTARLVRSDGNVLTGTVVLTAICRVSNAPETFVVNVAYGSRDLRSASLTLSGVLLGTYATPSFSRGVETFVVSGESFATHRVGYWTVGTSGVVHAFGGAESLGNAPGTADQSSFARIEPTPTGNGYWLVNVDGEVFAFGDARWFGDAPRQGLVGSVVTSLSSTPTGHGYWLFTSRGRVLPFGDAKFYGDMRNVALNGQVIGSVATPTGHGYYMVALDGGVFTFGDAKFRGSMGGAYLNQPVVGLVPTADNGGYWLVAADGGIFAFGAPFLGSTGNVSLARPMIGMVRYGTGYMMVAQDGGIFDFSNQPFFGSLGGSPFTEFTIGAAAIG